MIRYYELLTDLTVDDITKMKAAMAAGTLHPRQVKVDLAKTLIARFHGAEFADRAEEEFNRIFKDKGLPDEIPEFKMASQNGVWICHLMVQAGVATSTSEARRLIQQNAVEIENGKLTDPQAKLDFKAGQSMILKAGKKKFVKLVVTP
jgi:tyrosyl-tRNA synthetase